MTTETPTYAVVLAEEPFELRHYSGYLTANVRVHADAHAAAANQGFNFLADFIFGNNVDGDRIAMTAPVGAIHEPEHGAELAMTTPVMASRSEDDYVVTFTMPSEYTTSTLPRPNNPRIFIDRIDDHFAASVGFSGFLDEKKEIRHEQELRAWIAEKGLSTLGEAVAAQYDPPWRPWFVRRNEIIIPVDAPVAGRYGS
jgi:hypothetical protein